MRKTLALCVACAHHCYMDHIKHIKLLQRRGWTQAQIAAAAGINRSTLIRSMRDGAEIKVSTLLAIMKVSGRAPAKEKQK